MALTSSKPLDIHASVEAKARRSSWQQLNVAYLMAALAQVHQKLEQTVAQLQGREAELSSQKPLNPEDIAADMDGLPALSRLCQCFGLSDFERSILLLCAGRAIHPSFPNLFALIHQSADHSYPTFQVALRVFPEHSWQALTPQAPLRRWQLLQVAPGEDITHARLQIDEGILHYLMGEPFQDAVLMQSIQPIAQGFQDLEKMLQASHRTIANKLVGALQTPQSASIVQLCGSLHKCIRDMVVYVGSQMGYPLYQLSADAIPSDWESIQQLNERWQRWHQLSPSLLLLDAEDYSPQEEHSKRAGLEIFLQLVQTPIIIATVNRLYVPRRSLLSFEIKNLTYQEQLHLWAEAWSTAKISSQALMHCLYPIVAQFNLTPMLIDTASQSVQQSMGDGLANLDGRRNELSAKLWSFCRLQARPQLDNLAQRIETTATWDDLVLPQHEKEVLRNVIAQVRQRVRVYEEWGFSTKSGRGLGISTLFAGQSGTGKTMAAEVLAKEFQLDLYRIDLSAVVSKYIGETEKNLRRIFDAAETGGTVLLFDEADALFGKRTEVQDSHDRHANVEVSYLLQRMEAYQGLAILTTNLKGSLDQAFMRRLRFIVDFPFPDRTSRAEIWRRIFPAKTPTQNLKYELLKNLNVAGGNIRSIAMNAAFLAADAGEPVQMSHILQATQGEYIKLERPLTSSEIKGWVPKPPA